MKFISLEHMKQTNKKPLFFFCLLFFLIERCHWWQYLLIFNGMVLKCNVTLRFSHLGCAKSVMCCSTVTSMAIAVSRTSLPTAVRGHLTVSCMSASFPSC